MQYAIVDIETTGTYAAANSITEIAIHVFDGEKIVSSFESLVNPLQPIPRYIQSFTGITDEMVRYAPTFDEIAENILEVLKGKVFVAHNVNFDYSFIKSHLGSAGYEFNEKKLCTVRMSRKILPGFPSYSLGNLCHSLSISLINRHRAGGDASATVVLFKKLLEADKENHILNSLRRDSKEQILPPNVPKKDFIQLPSLPGVYYFHNHKGKIIYVGKAVNIKKRVTSHFSNNSDSRQKQHFLKHTYSITCQPCATELMACILESTEIKKFWPVFNSSQKKREDVFGIYSYTDQNGYLRLAIEKNKQQLKPLYSFHYLADGHAIMRKLINEYALCNRFCSMEKGTDACSGINEKTCKGACEHRETAEIYNERVVQAINSLSAKPSFVIVEDGYNPFEQACVLVWNGKFYGMGCVPNDKDPSDFSVLKDYIKPYRESSFTRNLVHNYASRFPSKVKIVSSGVLENLAPVKSNFSLQGSMF